jgi:uroporphyrinogen-III synthase
MKPVLLITRPLREAEDLAGKLSALGYEAHIEPLLTIETIPVIWPDPSGFDGIVATSARGIDAVPHAWSGKPLLAVGDHTAIRARRAGFTDVRSASGDAEDLELMIGKEAGMRCLLHACGMDGVALNVPGTDIVRLPVYKANKAEAFSAPLLSLLQNRMLAAALFYSPRTGQAFADLYEKHGCTHGLDGTKALCLSAPVVQSIRRLQWQDVQQANRPDQVSMISLVRRHILTA